MKIGIVAGETSGDYLGAGLMNHLKRHFPQMEFIGVGGPRMEAAGMESLYPMERISIMGLDDLLSSVSGILRIRRSLFNLFKASDLAMFVGIDVPDFNLGLERKLSRLGITTVHYVSPTVWAWRGYRIRKIKRSVSHMLTLFPFEAEFYKHHRLPVTFVGHPVADELKPDYERGSVRKSLHLSGEQPLVVALLPGSRVSELKRLGALFLQTAHSLQGKISGIQFAAPFANAETKEYFTALLEKYPDVRIKLFEGRSREVLAASDVALLASGTAALEAALLGTPMVVAYRGSWISYSLVKMLAHVDYFSMPNNLLDEPIVPELIQSRATVDNLVPELLGLLLNTRQRARVSSMLAGIGNELRCNANERAAEAIGKLLPLGCERQ